MDYRALSFDLPDNLHQKLKKKLSVFGGTLTPVFSLRDAMQHCEAEPYHLAILRPGEPDVCENFVGALRQISFMPIVILMDNFHEDTACPVLTLGADLCVPVDWSLNILAEHIMAAFRRYTRYTHYQDICGTEAVPFQEGDISIDPARHTAAVRGQPVKLRPREFSLLLYFMRNPGIVLTAEQICEKAWGIDGAYDHGIAQPIRMLRQAIEPDPKKPFYIETVRQVGYRYTAKCVETCDIF